MASEECFIFAFNKKEINSICNSDISEEFTERLDFLTECDLFKDVSVFTLLPIANTLRPKKFKLGEVIL